jgi:anthranilate synthase component 2
MRLLMIDNYDSFTYNLVQYFGELGQDVHTVRNDAITLEEIERAEARAHRHLAGPLCTPNEAGISVPLLRHFAGKLPLLGVCLGHQAIGAAFGGTHRACPRTDARQDLADRAHRHRGVQGLAQPVHLSFATTRWPSSAPALPDCLEVTAWTDDGEIMGVRHKTSCRSKACSSTPNPS